MLAGICESGSAVAVPVERALDYSLGRRTCAGTNGAKTYCWCCPPSSPARGEPRLSQVLHWLCCVLCCWSHEWGTFLKLN